MLSDPDEDRRRFSVVQTVRSWGESQFVRDVGQLLNLFVRGTGLVFGLVAVCAAISCLGGSISEHLDALTHLTPLWMAMGIGAICLSGIASRGFERRAIIGFGTIAVLICGGLMLPEYWAALRLRPAEAAPGDLKIVQFNVWDMNAAPEKTVDWIIAENADAVIIEEAGSERRLILQSLRAAYPYASCDKGKRCETVIFSRYAMVARGGNRTEGSRPSMAWARLASPEGTFNVVGVHYAWPLPVGLQREQAAHLAQTVARLDRKTTIVTGDFNSTPWSFALRRQDKALGLYRWTRALASWPAGQFSRVFSAPAPLLPIDHVYAGAGWRAVQVRRGPVLGSDHRPVVVTLRRQKD